MPEFDEDKRSEVNTLDIYQMRAITYIDQKFFSESVIPNADEVAFKVGVIPDTVTSWYGSRQFCNALRVRGIDLSLREDPEILDPKQVIAAHIILNTEDRRSLSDKLDDVGVKMPEWYGWLQQPRFRQYLRKRAIQLNDTTTTFALLKLDEAVQDGDYRAIETQLRMSNLYRPGVDVNINIQSFVLSVVEIIQKHVQDPTVIQAIAMDIEQLEQSTPGG